MLHFTSLIAPRWLLLAHQLPTRLSNARVKTWRRLQQLGAISVKNSVYVLPNSAQAVEDFEWLRSEIQGMKGQASIFTAAAINGLEDRDIVEAFQSVRAEDYRQFRQGLTRARAGRNAGRGTDRMRALRQLREQLRAIRQIDFFAAAGADEAERALSALERAAAPADKPPPFAAAQLDRKDFRHRLWVTRRRPGVDRFASAWLIRRFIDPDARFDFVQHAEDSKDALAFDMYAGGFKHEKDLCTFEVLQTRFGIADAAVRRIGEIVHDIDLKEERYRAPEAPALAALVEGLRASFDNDQELLSQGIVLFEALYRGLEDRKRATPSSTRAASKRKTGGRS